MLRGIPQTLVMATGAPVGNMGPFRAAGGAGDAAGAGPGSLAGLAALAIDHLLEPDGGSPRELDRLAESLPFDPAKLDQAIARSLDQIEDLGGILADLLSSEHLLPWIEGAALVAAASALAHHVRQKARSDGVSPGAGGQALASPWLLDLRSDD